MSKDKNKLIPKLRFPEFKDAGEWVEKSLRSISSRIVEKVGKSSLPTVSISAGLGFVSQAEKFGRDISGEQYKNYIFIQEGDFAYNKGNSKKYPQGCIYKLKEFKSAAAPNAFICFSFNKGYVADFYQKLFEANYHGEQLKKFITSGARSDGLLNISPDDFFSITLPSPEESEQQKIADCLSSLDELITAHNQKLENLKTYKKGLMQQLFPRDGETVPKLRFSEFKNAGEWGVKKLGEILSKHPDYGVNAPAVPYSEKLPTYLRITDISEDGCFISKQKVSVDINATSENYLHEGDIVLARTGASVGKSYKYKKEDGALVFAGFLIRIKPNNKKLSSDFLYNFLSTEQYWKWVNITSARSGQPGINGTEYSVLPIPIPPSLHEQQKIADCLSSLDELITAHNQKLDNLKIYKKGLMQQLFPAADEVNG